MRSVSEARIDIIDTTGNPVGVLTVALLPSTRSGPLAPLTDSRGQLEADDELEPVQLLEGTEYLYRIQVPGAQRLGNDRPELFYPDDASGGSGRLRTGLRTGQLPMRVFADDRFVGEVRLEVRSRKLDYLSQYRWMLRDIATVFAEVIADSFAATEQRFAVDESNDARTAYQRFAFLKSLLSDDAFVAALSRILRRPYVAWIESEEVSSLRHGVRATSATVRRLSRFGYFGHASAGAETPNRRESVLPREILITRTQETVDNLPNRFVRFAVVGWRDETARILTILKASRSSPAVSRGIDEVSAVLNRLEQILSTPLFQEVGPLDRIPAGNPVLLNGEGYRDVLRAYVQFEMAARLAWPGGEGVYGAGQRNVATLYEFWAYVQLSQIVSSFCQVPLNLRDLIEADAESFRLVLRQGREQVLRGLVQRGGRRLEVELWYNRTFASRTAGTGSWSRRMRPDFSICIRAEGAPSRLDPVWIHFDAKYRVQALAEILGDKEGDNPLEDDAVPVGPRGEAVRDDLIKMHAYRDAIRRSAGAYVIYPGSEGEQWAEYHELLPGLGAFGLQPSGNQGPVGGESIRQFLDDVMEHFARQTSQNERAQYWTAESFHPRLVPTRTPRFRPFLRRPPADTRVLLGYVRSQAHYQWVTTNHLYNVRADGRRGSLALDARELGIEFLLLYGSAVVPPEIWEVVGEPRLSSRDQLLGLGYPNPRGELYLCFQVAPLSPDHSSVRLTHDQIQRVRAEAQPSAPLGAPIIVSWQAVVEEGP